MKPSPVLSAPEAAAPFPGWMQLANPMASDGITLDRYRAGPSELLEVEVPDFCISLCRSAAARSESRESCGLWRTTPNDIGTISFVPPNSVVSLRWTGTADSVNLVVRASWIDAQESGYAPAIFPRRPTYSLRDKLTSGLIEDIYRDNLEGSPLGIAYAETMALAVLYRVAALHARHEPETKAVKNAQAIASAVDYIHENMDANLSLSEIVKAANFTTNLHSFIRAFRRHCGKAPHQYIIEIRLEKAKTMLVSNRHSVTDVALSCGFSSLSHFSGAFKKRWGVSPTEILRQRGIKAGR
jgi:AraC family transcriptional regulator